MVTRVPPFEPAGGSAAPRSGGGRRSAGSGDATWAGLRRAWRAIGLRVPRMRAELSRYAAARADLLRRSAARAGEHVVHAILVVVAIAAVLATATVLTIVGVAGGVAAALDGNVWAANLLTGGGVLGLLCVYFAIVRGARRAGRLRRLHQRYARFDRASNAPTADAGTADAPTTDTPATERATHGPRS